MPSLKMKSKVSTSCLTETQDLHVCPKSKIISKNPCSKIMISAQVAEIDTTVQCCQDGMQQLSARTLPKDIASDQSIDNKVFLDNDKSESQHQFSVCSSVMGRMELTNPCTANLETIFSPAFEPIEVHSQHHTEKDAGRIGDTDMLGVGVDEGRSICGYETCDVSDFYISDMIITSLPFGGNAFDDDIIATSCLSDYGSAEPSMFNACEQYMILPALEDDGKVSRTSDIVSYEEAVLVQEDASLYSAIGQIRSYNPESDVKNDLDKAESFDPQSFIKNSPELSEVELNGQNALIPKQSPRRKSVTLVLDLDETLVHSTLEHCDDADFTFTVFFNMKEYTVYVKQRPHLHTFFERVSEMFEVVIFTASQSIYANQLLDVLDPDERFISRRVYRESCIFSDGNYTKDLTVLGVDLAKVAIIDNSPQVFRLQVNNGIPIKSWFDDPLDCELMSLLPFLETLADADDVRPIIAKRYGNKE
ncbi:PREDICTED: CTD small phosphatase-like protein 2-A isoform X1 [Lupinus angustifolius]|nr:PREDICTED: CTD small phosphatase-like protein 2-A isoform X1 [Lupinus angustifolius]XP_019417675.1 PREDICTED: CTD small phosphatase-like protein 2-A isoform X1 [Lupinus angustifolius]XP_019417676.1 PREDICTED: CTD small phosphatase-like protein 2-A isoform X1 [Lupinus angustifolius]XP_019417678.1 PREDICTED: CTD small phosphatase-like protein 2-A isoform X1 [Lupinus angustifolius]XP_019417679.1 PREDICTED: CTD small phosphatase-like protein 2-A isoform X1 [Lupinus angustifolius]